MLMLMFFQGFVTIYNLCRYFRKAYYSHRSLVTMWQNQIISWECKRQLGYAGPVMDVRLEECTFLLT